MGSTPSRPSDTFDCVEEKSSLQEAFTGLNIEQPKSQDGSLLLDNVVDWERGIASDSKAQLARTILSHTNLKTALQSRPAFVADQHIFSHELDFKTGPRTNQKSSGRCWLFATTNILRYDVMKSLNLKDFELSQSYLFFWDKLSKSNFFLELAIENAYLPIDDRLVSHLSDDLISDGGQWDMAVNLIENYGFVPQSIYPESLHSSLSSPLNALLKTKLREHQLILRRLAADLKRTNVAPEDVRATLRAEKEKLMKEVYTIMSATLGVPPLPTSEFTFEYNDANGKFGSWTGNALQFAKRFSSKSYPPAQSFSLIHDPRNTFSQLYTVDKLGNVWGGRPVLYVNTEIGVMKQTVVKMIKAGVPVFFGCDVGKSSESVEGLMDTNLYAYENAFDIKLGLTKAERLQVNESAMTHAMVISGVHLDTSGSPVRYKVENSWGNQAGKDGWFVMTDKWFEEFVYQIVVPKALAPKDLVKVLESGNASVLPAWDPMGSLA